MIYAEKNGEKVLPKKGETANCPLCSQKVIARCGLVNVWHWAHEKEECDSWYEPITKWHLDWQSNFSENQREVVIKDKFFQSGKKHIADILLPNDVVIEFQNSTISAGEILEREGFYRKMIWVVNVEKASHNISLSHNKLKIDNCSLYKWLWLRRCWRVAKMPIFLDFGDDFLLYVKELKNDYHVEYKYFPNSYYYWRAEYNMLAVPVSKNTFLAKYANVTQCPKNAPHAAQPSQA